ncbi:hypothetical protein PM082_006458 [Marasmius tenuissimus]|nr:hypothetical protein PM082_006458 [Marasmius tenuissimus]
MQSTFFPNAQGFHISGGSFSHVQGDQYNHTALPIPSSSSADPSFSLIDETTTSRIMAVYNVNGNQVNQVIQHERKEPTEFDDYRIVKRGDICIYRDVCVHDTHRRCQCDECQQAVTKTVCIAKVNGAQGKFTVMSYSGPGGRKAFEKDFRKFSNMVTSSVPQMYAVDIGSVPSILYWNELVPAVVLKGNLGRLGQTYLYSLRNKWHCTEEELWMDPARGIICPGPEGPYPALPMLIFESEDIPSTVDLLQDDVCMRFMASCRSKEVDRVFLHGIRSTGSDVAVPEKFDQPTVFSVLTQTPIAVANNLWESERDDLAERKVLANGLTRFRVVGGGGFWLDLNEDVEEAWLCQAPRVFRAQGISLGDDESVYYLVWRRADLYGYLSDNEIHLQRRSQQPIYLFIHLPPPNLPDGKTSSLHFWSFHEDGQNPLPPDICDNLGLPTKLEYEDYGYNPHSWPTKSYRLMDEYQRLRGFNPTTTAFARHLGYDGNIFESVNDTDRFDDVHDERCIEPRESTPILDCPNHSNVDNGSDGTEYPMATQLQSCNENLDSTLVGSEGEPALAHIIAKCHRMGTGEEMIEHHAQAEQDIRTDFTSPGHKQAATELWDSTQPVCEIISRNTGDLKEFNKITQAQNLRCHDVEYTDSPTSHTPLGYDFGSDKTSESAPKSDVSGVGFVRKGTSALRTPLPGHQGVWNPISAWNTSCTDDTDTPSAQPENVKSSSNVPDRAYDYMTRSAGGLEHPSTVAEGISQHRDIRVRTRGTDVIHIPDPTPDNSLRFEGVDSSTPSVRDEEPKEVLDPVTAIASERSEVLLNNGDIPSPVASTSVSNPNDSGGLDTNPETGSDRRLGEPSSRINAQRLHPKLNRDRSSAGRLPSLLMTPRGASKSLSTPEAARTNVYVHRRERDRGRDSASDVVRRLCSYFSLG